MQDFEVVVVDPNEAVVYRTYIQEENLDRAVAAVLPRVVTKPFGRELTPYTSDPPVHTGLYEGERYRAGVFLEPHIPSYERECLMRPTGELRWRATIYDVETETEDTTGDILYVDEIMADSIEQAAEIAARRCVPCVLRTGVQTFGLTQAQVVRQRIDPSQAQLMLKRDGELVTCAFIDGSWM
jgi:hypothetical protein